MPRTGQDIEHAGGMDRDIFCAGCGYNLRHGAIVGRCPECGGPYDARSLSRTGIFSPQDLGLPWGDLLVAAVCAGIGLFALYHAIEERTTWLYAPAAIFLVFMLFFLRATALRTVKFFRYRALARRVERDSREDT